MSIDNAIWRTIVLCLLFPFSSLAQRLDGPPAGERPDTLRLSFSSASIRPVAHSLYCYMKLIDERPDSSFLGLITTTTPYDLRVQLARPMGEELHGLMSRLVGAAGSADVAGSAGSAGSVGSSGSGGGGGFAGLAGSTGSTGSAGSAGSARSRAFVDSVGEDTLAMQLRSFLVYTTSTRLHIYLRFNLYVYSGLYEELTEVDTLISTPFKHGSLSDLVSTALASVIGRALTMSPDPNGDLFSLGVLRTIDQIKKNKLPLYRVAFSDHLTDGVYLTYTSFSQMKPDHAQFSLDTSSGVDMEHAGLNVDGVSSGSASGSMSGSHSRGSGSLASVRLEPGQVFAYVKDGKAYVSVGDHYALLRKMGSDLYITSRLLLTSQDANLTRWAVTYASTMQLPLVKVWGLMEQKKFWMLMDYRYGTFRPVRPVD